ncbi:MAG: chorismate synthase [Bacteroidales bacterium]|nr:chorismate synthase [Bacteroidales bacterium]MBR6846901.1 chorismate synthase [Bacteroidales bacterium]
MIKFTSFGESHGVAVGGVIEGCPAGLAIDFQSIQEDLARRATGKTSSESQRREPDEVEFLSGLLDGVTLGTPIAFLVRNTDARPEDYADLKDVFRPSHADFTYQAKYGIRDWRGGGRASARTMLPYVVAGAIAKQLLAAQGIKVSAEVHSIGGETNPAKIEALLQQCREEGDSVGGIVRGSITGLPAGLGEPLDDKFQACLAKAMFTIPAVKGFEYGDGFAMASMRGSETNDQMDGTTFLTNHSGGIQGGITNGEEVFFNVAFKPIPTLGRGNRHDVCTLPRATVIVEAMAALTIVRFKL